MTFSDFSLSKELHASVQRMGFEQPTPIQQAAIPPASGPRRSGQRGDGKRQNRRISPSHHEPAPAHARGATRALVLAPTRELAAQIAEHFKELAAGTRLTCAAVFGGVGMGPPERAFRKGVDMIVACPGRLLDHMREHYADLPSLQVPRSRRSGSHARHGLYARHKEDSRRHSPGSADAVLFATLPPAIVDLAGQLLRYPVRIDIDRKPAPGRGVSHAVYPVTTDRKSELLLELLDQRINGSVLVFTRTKHRANRLADYLDKNGVACGASTGIGASHSGPRRLPTSRKATYQVSWPRTSPRGESTWRRSAPW